MVLYLKILVCIREQTLGVRIILRSWVFTKLHKFWIDFISHYNWVRLWQESYQGFDNWVEHWWHQYWVFIFKSFLLPSCWTIQRGGTTIITNFNVWGSMLVYICHATTLSNGHRSRIMMLHCIWIRTQWTSSRSNALPFIRFILLWNNISVNDLV